MTREQATVNREQELREKVLKGLKLCANDCAGWGCPYYLEIDCVQKLHTDALALMKEPPPRLVTAEDFNGDRAMEVGGAIPCWKEPKSPTRREGWTVIVYGKWLADRGLARYWTEKPTTAQKEETPW